MGELAVGLTCNNYCVMCPNIIPPSRRSWDNTTKELKRRIMNFNKDDRGITITGGEPTIRSDFFHILQFIKKEMPKSRILLLTNGRMFCYLEFTRKFINTGCDSVAIPLHAHNAELHDAITRAPDSFEQTVQGIKNLLKYRTKVDTEIRVVIHKLNYSCLPDIANFISEEFKGIWQVVLFPIDIIGNANTNRNRLMVSMTDVKPYLKRGLTILEKNSVNFRLYHIPFCIVDKKYWKNIAGRTVEERRVTFEPCGKCIMKESCPGIWKTYAFRVGIDEFNPIKHP